jgi:hypothetical protein
MSRRRLISGDEPGVLHLVTPLPRRRPKPRLAGTFPPAQDLSHATDTEVENYHFGPTKISMYFKRGTTMFRPVSSFGVVHPRTPRPQTAPASHR